MGIPIPTATFTEDDYTTFRLRLSRNLEALQLLLQRPEFGRGPMSIGAELELVLVDRDGEPTRRYEKLMESLNPKIWGPEMDRFNIECNTPPYPLAGHPFGLLGRELDERLHQVRLAGRRHGVHIVMIGILPTFRPEHFGPGALTDTNRYQAMNRGLRRMRNEPFHVNIHGADDLVVDTNDVAFEGANTSFQLHLRVDPDAFANTYNAAQIATPIALAAAGNSPVFLGRRLWDETRIALFKEAVDDRDETVIGAGKPPPRVSFGSDWVRTGAHEVFSRVVLDHAALLPLNGDEDPVAVVRDGGTPKLLELRVQNGTVWLWNRPVYDPVAGGHLRIELRALPAGPTIVDMVANVAYLVGLTLGLAPRARDLIQQLPFESAQQNFYRAARAGLNAELTFPDKRGNLTQRRAADLAIALLPIARKGLIEAGVDPGDCDSALAIMDARLRTERTGAKWMRAHLPSSPGTLPTQAELSDLLASYTIHSAGGLPIHAWPPPRILAEDAEASWEAEVTVTNGESAPPIRYRRRPAPHRVPENVEDFLRELRGPTWMTLPGIDRTRQRIVTTLLHGNEPSGIRSMHQYLRSQRKPAVDTVFYIGQVDAALHPPIFSNRMLPGHRDYNRCFAPPHDDGEGRRALAFMAHFARQNTRIGFEAAIDLHNNTGRSPAYGVACGISDARLNLTDLFGDRYIDSDIRLRTLVEFTTGYCPSITVECGTAGDPMADAAALAGLERFLSLDQLNLSGPPARHIQILSRPVRVHLRENLDVVFAPREPAEPNQQASLVLRANMEAWNLSPIAAGTCIGWVRPGVGWPLDARGADGIDVSQDLFEQQGDELRTRREMIPVMMTSDPRVARADCLFYAMVDGRPN